MNEGVWMIGAFLGGLFMGWFMTYITLSKLVNTYKDDVRFWYGQYRDSDKRVTTMLLEYFPPRRRVEDLEALENDKNDDDEEEIERPTAIDRIMRDNDWLDGRR